MPWANGDPLSPANLNAKSGFGQHSVLDPAYSADSSGVANSTASVQAALNAVVTQGGGVVFFPKGTYLVSELTVGPSTVLLGQGGASVLKNSTNTSNSVLRNVSVNTSGYSGDADILIENLQIDGNQQALASGVSCTLVSLGHARNVTLRNLRLKNAGHHAVDICACTNVVVEGCNISDISSGAIQIDEARAGSLVLALAPALTIDNSVCSQVIVRGCVIDNATTGPGIHLHKAGAAHVLLDGNIISRTQSGIADDGTSEITGAANVIISNNIIKDINVANHAIALWTGSRNVSIAGNSISSGNQYGILVAGQSGNTQAINVSITGNSIDSVGRSGIRLDRCLNGSITGNSITTLTGTDFAGIDILNSQRITLGDNSVFPNSGVTNDGIRISTSTQVAVSGNVISNASHGIRISGQQARYVVSGNEVFNCFNNAIRIEGDSTSLRLKKIAIQGNVIDANSEGLHPLRVRFSEAATISGNVVSGTNSGTNAGISVSDVSAVAITGNTIDGNAEGAWGIAVTVAPNAAVVGNMVKSCVTGIEALTSAESVAIVGNVCFGNTGSDITWSSTVAVVASNLTALP